ncbi:High mobility group B protein 6 [Raphanus sativus]|nr:High mobility group B protein 6 [Raphanus sativus]
MELLNDEHKLKIAIDLLDSPACSYFCRKHKDPLKPKHPISAFMFYANERRAAFREENKNVLEVAKMEKTGRSCQKNIKHHMKRSIFVVVKKNKKPYLEAMEEYKRTKGP